MNGTSPQSRTSAEMSRINTNLALGWVHHTKWEHMQICTSSVLDMVILKKGIPNMNIRLIGNFYRRLILILKRTSRHCERTSLRPRFKRRYCVPEEGVYDADRRFDRRTNKDSRSGFGSGGQ